MGTFLRRALFAVFLALFLPAFPTADAAPKEIVLVEPQAVSTQALAGWKSESFSAVAVILDDAVDVTFARTLNSRVAESGMDLYWWIEVARNPTLANAHPRWMASLGSHNDWQKNFPSVRKPGPNEVAKAFPWVPIGYREAFDAHLARIERLLKRLPPGASGILLNDMQAGPSSCGCGNVLCRWALDYHVPSTATKLEGHDVAARFLAEVRKRLGIRKIIPVWTTECETVDLPPDKQDGQRGTGLCGTVGCATGACPEKFRQQWAPLTAGQDGPVALLGLHRALQRTQPQFGGGPAWTTNALAYLDQTAPTKVPRDRLWLVVEGASATEEAAARKLAAVADVSAVIVARVRIDQSYEPRIISVR